MNQNDINILGMRADQEERYLLPSHLEFCDNQSNNPWQNLFMQDFILVAEFSEHEGPRPLVSNYTMCIKMFNIWLLVCPIYQKSQKLQQKCAQNKFDALFYQVVTSLSTESLSSCYI